KMPDGSQVLYKQPWEQKAYQFDFSALIPDGRTIATVDSVAQVAAGHQSGSADVTLGTPAAAGRTVQVSIGDGTAGERYKLTARVTDSEGDKHEGEGHLMVVDL
ncbi:MAG TPA: hypothetical protein VKA32_00500, partial [Gammaproteobacteria bacterium]|nr:hypothetical protein [Gammaproteobacteria bacterium]